MACIWGMGVSRRGHWYWPLCRCRPTAGRGEVFGAVLSSANLGGSQEVYGLERLDDGVCWLCLTWCCKKDVSSKKKIRGFSESEGYNLFSSKPSSPLLKLLNRLGYLRAKVMLSTAHNAQGTGLECGSSSKATRPDSGQRSRPRETGRE